MNVCQIFYSICVRGAGVDGEVRISIRRQIVFPNNVQALHCREKTKKAEGSNLENGLSPIKDTTQSPDG